MSSLSMRSKRVQFGYITKRVRKRIQGWNAKTFSVGGKEVLIKSVLQAVSTYVMSCFRLPASISREIESICANFWWGKEEGHNRMHWLSWDKLCRPKCEGGMGFRKIQVFNQALLAKQIWRILHNPHSLVSRILKGRYYRHDSLLDAKIGHNPSYFWQSLLWSRNLLHDGLYWRIGDGANISIYKDRWILVFRKELSEPTTGINDDKVESLIINGQWDSNTLNNRFPAYVNEEIQRIPLPSNKRPDSLYWYFDEKGKYSVRSGYKKGIGFFDSTDNCSEKESRKWWKWMWSLNLPPKIWIFFWRIAHDILPTAVNLSRHHVPVDVHCQLCGYGVDTSIHSLVRCPATIHLWKNTKFHNLMKSGCELPTLDFCGWLHISLSKAECEECLMQMWAIWLERQSKLHEGQGYCIAHTVLGHVEHLLDYKSLPKPRSTAQALMQNPRSDEKLKLPEHGTWRVDVDTCYNEDAGHFGIGGIIQTSLGHGILAFGWSIPGPSMVLEGELIALHEGLKVVKTRQISPV